MKSPSTIIVSIQSIHQNGRKDSKAFGWTSISKENERLEDTKFYGKMVLHYEAGRVVLLRFEQTKKP